MINIAVLRHGIGRETQRALPILEKGLFKDIINSSIIKADFYYLFREVTNETSIRNNEEAITSINLKLQYEKQIEVKLGKNFTYPNFKKILKKDVHKDNYQSYKHLFNQLYMFKEFEKRINLDKYCTIVVIRDDIIINKCPNIEEIINFSKNYYTTSIWDWEGGTFERFFICPIELFIKLCYKEERILNKIQITKEKINPFYLCGEWLSYKTIKNSNYSIMPYNIKTTRLRSKGGIANERHRIRFNDLREVYNIIVSILKSHIKEKLKTIFKYITVKV